MPELYKGARQGFARGQIDDLQVELEVDPDLLLAEVVTDQLVAGSCFRSTVSLRSPVFRASFEHNLPDIVGSLDGLGFGDTGRRSARQARVGLRDVALVGEVSPDHGVTVAGLQHTLLVLCDLELGHGWVNLARMSIGRGDPEAESGQDSGESVEHRMVVVFSIARVNCVKCRG